MIIACLSEKSVIKTWLSLHKQYPDSSSDLLSLLQNNETSVPALSSSKELRNIRQQLQTVSNDEETNTNHQEFLRAHSKNDTITMNKRQTRSKSRVGLFFKLLVFSLLAFTIYSNWLWLTVAADYLLEDYLKHPTAIVIKQRLADGCAETKRLTGLSLKYAEEYTRTTIANVEPYAIQFNKYLQKQWNVLLKYVEGPIYDKSVEIAEQIQRLTIIVFNQSVRYLNLLFEWASYYTANLTSLTEVYLKQVYAILYDKWTHFDASKLQEKFNQLRARVIKSV